MSNKAILQSATRPPGRHCFHEICSTCSQAGRQIFNHGRYKREVCDQPRRCIALTEVYLCVLNAAGVPHWQNSRNPYLISLKDDGSNNQSQNIALRLKCQIGQFPVNLSAELLDRPKRWDDWLLTKFTLLLFEHPSSAGDQCHLARELFWSENT